MNLGVRPAAIGLAAPPKAFASAKLVESDLEAALLNELQAFLLEPGKGFAFVSRQERITLDGDDFKCYLVYAQP